MKRGKNLFIKKIVLTTNNVNLWVLAGRFDQDQHASAVRGKRFALCGMFWKQGVSHPHMFKERCFDHVELGMHNKNA